MPSAALLELQEHDSAIDAIDRRLAELPEAKAVTAAEVLIKDAASRIAEFDTTLTEHERARSRIDGDVERSGARIDAAKDKLMSGNVSNPRELSALQDEIAMLGRQKSEHEDRELEEMVVIDDLKSERDELAGRRAELESEIEGMRSARDARVADLDVERGEHVEHREKAVAFVDASVLKVYDRVRPKHAGVGAAALEGNICRSCNMTLTAQDLIEVKETKVPRCPNCEVILVESPRDD